MQQNLRDHQAFAALQATPPLLQETRRSVLALSMEVAQLACAVTMQAATNAAFIHEHAASLGLSWYLDGADTARIKRHGRSVAPKDTGVRRRRLRQRWAVACVGEQPRRVLTIAWRPRLSCPRAFQANAVVYPRARIPVRTASIARRCAEPSLPSIGSVGQSAAQTSARQDLPLYAQRHAKKDEARCGSSHSMQTPSRRY